MAPSSPPPLSRETEPLRRRARSLAGPRPIRAQALLGFMLVVMLIAVPLYLLRRPTPRAPQASASAARSFGGVIRSEYDAGAHAPEVALGPLQRVRCGPSAAQAAEGAACDALPLLEAALRQGILSNVECAPREAAEGSLNYVLEVDFTRGRLNVFAGKSGRWRGARARRAVTCVLRSLPPLEWADIEHQHQYYAIAILATYPGANDAIPVPTFE